MVSFQIVSDSPDLHSRWPLLLKIFFCIAYYCFISNINSNYMKIRSSTFLLCFSMKYFFQPIYSNYVNRIVFDKKKSSESSHWNPLKTYIVRDGSCVSSVHICVRQLLPCSRWPLLLKYFFELLITAYFEDKVNSNLNCSCITMSSSSFLLDFSV